MIQKSQRFFNQESANLITKLSTLRQNIYIKKYPLIFHNYGPQSSQSSFIMPKTNNNKYAIMFQKFIRYLQNPHQHLKHSQKKSFLKSLFTSNSQKQKAIHIQPNLISTIKENAIFSQFSLEVDNIQVTNIELNESIQIRGVFIHRNFNMPLHCYSVERNQKKKFIAYRMRKKLMKEQDIDLFNRKLQAFQNDNLPNYLQEGQPISYQMFYFDDYKHFIQKECILRQLVEIKAIIKGRLHDKEKDKVYELPLQKNMPVTTHAFQVEKPKIPNQEDYMVTDIDFYMKTNPYVSGL